MTVTFDFENPLGRNGFAADGRGNDQPPYLMLAQAGEFFVNGSFPVDAVRGGRNVVIVLWHLVVGDKVIVVGREDPGRVGGRRGDDDIGRHVCPFGRVPRVAIRRATTGAGNWLLAGGA